MTSDLAVDHSTRYTPSVTAALYDYGNFYLPISEARTSGIIGLHYCYYGAWERVRVQEQVYRLEEQALR